MKNPRGFLRALPGLLLLTACSSPVDPELIPPLVYLPTEQTLQVDYGTLLDFEVRDLVGNPYTVEFQVGSDAPVRGATLRWRVDRVGEISIVAIARSEGASRTHRWTVQAGTSGLDPVGPVRTPLLSRRPVRGSLQLGWSSPERRFEDPPLSRYEIAYALQSIEPSRFEEFVSRQVEHRQGVELYQLSLEDLEPGREYFVRVRAVDELGREGTLSPELIETTATLFSLSGRIQVMDPYGADPTPLGGVELEAQGQQGLSDGNGEYLFTDLLDFMPIRIEATAAGASPQLYSISRDLMAPDEAPFDYLFLPVREVQVSLPQLESMDFLRLLRWLSSQLSDNTRVSHWESYPVEVEVRDMVLDNGVDYGAALRRGIQKWNQAMGFEVLRENPSPPVIGAIVRYDVPFQGGAPLGSVDLVSPADGTLFQTVPRRVRLALMEYFDSQQLIDRVVIHELGHVLYLTHSPSTKHVMGAGVNLSSPNEVHPDEVAVLRALIHTPNGTRYGWYVDPR